MVHDTRINVKYALHNHDLLDRFEDRLFLCRLSSYERQHVDLTKHHVPPRHILLSLQEQGLDNITQVTQIFN